MIDQRLGLPLFNISLQRGYIDFEGIDTCLCDTTDGTRHLAAEGLLHGDIARFLQFIDLHAEISRRSARLFAQIDEVGAFDSDQDGHYCQPQLGVQEGIEFLKHGHGVRYDVIRRLSRKAERLSLRR